MSVYSCDSLHANECHPVGDAQLYWHSQAMLLFSMKVIFHISTRIKHNIPCEFRGNVHLIQAKIELETTIIEIAELTGSFLTIMVKW